MDDIIVQQAMPEDAEQLALLMAQLGYPISTDNMLKNLILYSNKYQACAFVAVHQNKIIGCIAVHLSHLFHDTQKSARITTLIVDKEFRRHGVGSKLIKVGEDYAKQMGCRLIELTSGMQRKNMGSHDFYRDMGYDNSIYEKQYLRKVF